MHLERLTSSGAYLHRSVLNRFCTAPRVKASAVRTKSLMGDHRIPNYAVVVAVSKIIATATHRDPFGIVKFSWANAWHAVANYTDQSRSFFCKRID